MTISFINKNEYANTASATITINKPTNTAQNDVMIAVIAVEDYTDRINSDPEGWTRIWGDSPGTRAIFQAVYWKVAGASEPSSYSWGLDATDECCGSISTFRGCVIADPIGNHTFSTATGASASCTAPAIAVAAAGNWLVHTSAIAYGTWFTPPPPAGAPAF